MKKYATLPFASTLCGSCSDVCPVKIDIHTQLYKWRQIIAQEGHLSRSNLHDAYRRLGTPLPAFGMFLCGPSKTADIEQSLVEGALGARSLMVLLYGT